MDAKITVEADKTKEVAVAIVGADFFKSKTKIVLAFDKESLIGDLIGGIRKDVAKMYKTEGKVKAIMFEVSGAKSIGRIINRSVGAFERMGVTIADLPDWGEDTCSVVLKGDITTSDIAPLMTLLALIAERASRKIGGTQHPLTIFDLKQTVGIVFAAKGNDKQAVALMKWFGGKEDIAKAQEKEAKKAKAKSTAAARTVGKNSSEATPGKAASLSNLAA